MTWTVLEGDCLPLLREMPDCSIDSVVTDPPYGLSREPDAREVLTRWLAGEDYEHRGPGFMGRSWDSFVPGPAVWREVLRVLKPGGHALVFAGTRTVDLMGMSLRLAGFEMRDCLDWIYSSGFPKSLSLRDIGRPELGTAIKPAHEPILFCRRPLDGTVAANVLKWGTGGLSIDACRVGTTKQVPRSPSRSQGFTLPGRETGEEDGHNSNVGRFPPNLLLSHSPLCERVGEKKVRGGSGWSQTGSKESENRSMSGKNYDRPPRPDAFTSPDGTETVEDWRCAPGCAVARLDAQTGEANSGPASRFFPCFAFEAEDFFPALYCAKASRAEREAGCEHLPPRTGAEAVSRQEGSAGLQNPRAGAGRTAGQVRNHHPTVKPRSLCQWLVRLITPPGGTVLDPFAGSGSIGVGALLEGFHFVGCEITPEYLPILRARLEWAERQARGEQLSLFDMLGGSL